MSAILSQAKVSAAMQENAGDRSSAPINVDAILDAVSRRLLDRRLPEATYRLQVNANFTFRDACAQVGYLSNLGISDCYLSPCLKACPGSLHGYDIVDHNSLNPELGGEDDYNALVSKLKLHDMGLILDIVPNHMGIASDENTWWNDVLENGPGSPYATFFDIDWMPLKPDLADKVLLPILGDQFGKVLEDQQLAVAFDNGAFVLHYFDRKFPIAPRSWARILGYRIDELQPRLESDEPQMQEYQSILTAITHLPVREETEPEKVRERQREKEVIKRRLMELSYASPVVNDFIRENVTLLNGRRGSPQSFDFLEQLLSEQAYRLAYWRVAADEINYRRFFDVDDMAAICMENPEVFEKTHHLILRLLSEGKATGLRIDHPDGLYDPAEYLRSLQRATFLQLCRQEFEAASRCLTLPETDEAAAWTSLETDLAARFDELSRAEHPPDFTRPLYVVAEKILEAGERLPENWPVNGTTGYDFLNALNAIFVDRAQSKVFDSLYTRFIYQRLDFKELAYRCKKLIMEASMSAEIAVLGHQLDRISERNRNCRDFTLNSLTSALREVVACFPVYRTYVTTSSVLDRDRRYIKFAVAHAKRRNPATSASIFDLVRDILLFDNSYSSGEETQAAQQRFVGKFQQVTSPVMAKAVEDTACYIDNRLVSLNEVGGDPERFGIAIAVFHQQNVERQTRWPHSLLATSTHDTKRSEDVRARINVLSEIPKEFRTHIFHWARLNQRKKTKIDDEQAPTRNDEYLLYQTLVGTWPLETFEDVSHEVSTANGQAPRTAGESEKLSGQSTPPLSARRAVYCERIQQYMLKAMREAKVNTSWISPNESYERAVHDFVAAILRPSRSNVFLTDLEPFARRIADIGIWNSLSQTLIKLTAPGVPDLYQGTELWDFSLVDPDNRRPVDFALRQSLLESISRRMRADGTVGSDLAQELVAQRIDGRIKLYLIWRMLNFRRGRPGLCTTGRYFPLDAAGEQQEHLCAFARQTPHGTLLVVVPRLIAGLVGHSSAPPIGSDVWKDTTLMLPQEIRALQYRNLFTGEILNAGSAIDGAAVNANSAPLDHLLVATILGTFPVAALETVRP